MKEILLSKEEVDKKYYLSERALAGIANKKEVSKEKGFGFGAQFLNLDKPSFTIPAETPVGYWGYTPEPVKQVSLDIYDNTSKPVEYITPLGWWNA